DADAAPGGVGLGDTHPRLHGIEGTAAAGEDLPGRLVGGQPVLPGRHDDRALAAPARLDEGQVSGGDGPHGAYLQKGSAISHDSTPSMLRAIKYLFPSCKSRGDMGATARMLLIVPLIVLLLAAVAGGPARAQEAVPPPRPLLPIPTSRQLDWQRDELRMFVHFGVNTFTDREWGTGEEDPAIFNPSALDAAQWARVAREAGFKTMILTAKHHDGFALWP